jgi:phosphate:Na+ symporter
MALPILALGVALRMAASGKRLEGLGNALAGFGLFFLGLAILQVAFGGMATEFGGQLVVADEGLVGILIYVGVGFIATVLTQSYSAAIAIILTAATQSVIGIEAAAAAIIGANVGTTSTALFAVIKAPPPMPSASPSGILPSTWSPAWLRSPCFRPLFHLSR